MELIRSPLHEVHISLGAKLTGFGGWEMPLQYEGVLAEHRAVRAHAGLFDVSHLGKLLVRGDEQIARLDRLLPGKVAAIEPYRAGYNLVLNDDGGVVDDIFCYRFPDHMLLVPNASNTMEVLQYLKERSVEAEDARMRWAIIALSGPAAPALASQLDPALGELKLHRFNEFSVAGSRMMVAKTGYTGEPTLEFFSEWDEAPRLWHQLLTGEVKPAGLGARDTLRLEMGYPLHGHEISAQIDPLSAGLGWLIDWDKPFVGKQALEKIKQDGPREKLVGLVAIGREIPRQGFPIILDDRQVGELVSGNFSPVIGKGIAMGYVSPEHAVPGTRLKVQVRGRDLEMEVTSPPFIKDGR